MKLRSPFKIVLAIFSVYMVIHSQNAAFAQGGVPWGRLVGQTETSLVGTYAGVMLPEGADPDNQEADFVEANVLGLFATSVGLTGLSSGVCVIFVNGIAAYGTMVALGDPGKGTISAVLSAIRTVTRITEENGKTVTRIVILAEAAGRFTSKLVQTNERSAFIFPRLEGEGALSVRFGGFDFTQTVPIIVDGYRQSTAPGQLGAIAQFGDGN